MTDLAVNTIAASAHLVARAELYATAAKSPATIRAYAWAMKASRGSTASMDRLRSERGSACSSTSGRARRGGGTGTYFDHRHIRRMHITANGCALYEREWARYPRASPRRNRSDRAEIEAIEPKGQLVNGG